MVDAIALMGIHLSHGVFLSRFWRICVGEFALENLRSLFIVD
ncbi:MAG: hypothetical protein WA947_03595 [Phormidesmis sp.]